MVRKTQTSARQSTGVRFGRWIAVCVMTLALAALTSTNNTNAQDFTSTDTLTVTTRSLPANFESALHQARLVMVAHETLETLGLELITLQVKENETNAEVFRRLIEVFPDHPFEQLKSDALDYELSAL